MLDSRALRLSGVLLAVSFASCLAEGGEPDRLPRTARRLGELSGERLTRIISEAAAARAAPAEPEPELAPESGDVLASDDEDRADVLPAAALTSDARPDEDQALAAIAKETFVRSAPSFGAKKIGYLRGGAVVRRSAEPAGNAGCAGGWYKIAPYGFVCVGKSATLDVGHPLVTASARRPDRQAALPYAYGMSLFPTPPFYTKLPSEREQRSVEQDLERHRRSKLDPGWSDVLFEPVPELLAGGRQVMTWNGVRHSTGSLYAGRAMPKSGFAFIDFFEHEGRKLGLTVDLDVVPLDRLKRVQPSSFQGLALDDATTLPVVFALTKYAKLYAGDPVKAGLKEVRAVGYREALPITGRKLKANGTSYVETTKGEWLRDEYLVRVDPIKNKPGWATPGRTWLEISILEQSLVAYEGTKPVYVTLVSTGADGLGDPKETHSTVRGQFLVHTKHLTATMSGDELGDEFDLRDVPYVQYFKEGYALHAAYWHDSFGRPRSHGCVNLSPLDARWLFHWTDPPVPQGWHGAMSLREGTLVHVHP